MISIQFGGSAKMQFHAAAVTVLNLALAEGTYDNIQVNFDQIVVVSFQLFRAWIVFWVSDRRTTIMYTDNPAARKHQIEVKA